MSRSSEVRFLITGNADSATKALREVADAAQKTGAITAAQAKVITKAFEDIDRKSQGMNRTKVQDAGRSVVGGRLDQMAGGGIGGDILSGFGGAEKLLAGVSTQTLVATAGMTAFAAASLKAGQIGVQSFTSVGAAVGKFQQTLGVSAEEATKFWYALSASGVNPEQGLDAINQFSVNITQNADDLERFGVAVEKNNKGFTDIQGTLANVIERYQELSEAGNNAAAAQLLSVSVGEEGMRQLQPLLRRGADEFRELSKAAENVLTEDDLARLDDFNAAMGGLKAQAQLAAAQLGAELVPALTTLLQGVEPLIGPLGQMAGVLGKIWAAAAQPITLSIDVIGSFVDFVKNIVPGMGDVGDAAEEAAGGADTMRNSFYSLESEVEKATARFAAAAAAARQLTGAFQSSAASRISAAQSHKQAVAGVATAEMEAAVSIEQANRQAAQSVAAAESQVSSAYASMADASAGLEKAEQQAARQRADANKAAAKAVADAEKQVVKAREDADEAVRDFGKAQAEADEVVADAAEDAAARIVDAQDRVTDARERAARLTQDNARRLEDAEQAVRDALTAALEDDNPFDASRRREEAYRDLGRTREDVAESEMDAAADVQEAEAGLKDATVEAEETRADAAEQAAEIITAARERITDATERAHEAEVSLADTVAESEQRKADAAASAADSINSARAQVWSASQAVKAAEANLRDVMVQAEQQRQNAAITASYNIANARAVEIRAAMDLLAWEDAVLRNRENLARQNANAGNPLPYGQAAANIAAGKPQFHDGGIYRSPGGTNEGLAMLKDGEGVFTPGQMAALGGGGGVSITINGSVYGDRRQLMEEITRAVREGYGGSN